MELILKYFPGLSPAQVRIFEQLLPVYREWNSRINVISRRDIDNLYLHHVLHSLSIARVIQFTPGTRICDAGTGGGFPGIPLAILFPDVTFHLVDSIGKKIKVVNEVIKETGLKNVTAEQKRIEELKMGFDFVISRAVTSIPNLLRWIQPLILSKGVNEYPNGLFYLKGEPAGQDPSLSVYNGKVIPISQIFTEEYFQAKVILYIGLPFGNK